MFICFGVHIAQLIINCENNSIMHNKSLLMLGIMLAYLMQAYYLYVYIRMNFVCTWIYL